MPCSSSAARRIVTLTPSSASALASLVLPSWGSGGIGVDDRERGARNAVVVRAPTEVEVRETAALCIGHCAVHQGWQRRRRVHQLGHRTRDASATAGSSAEESSCTCCVAIRSSIWVLKPAKFEQGAFLDFEVVPKASFDDGLEY